MRPRTSSTSFSRLVAGLVSAAALILTVWSQLAASSQAPGGAPGQAATVARGEYLANRVAMCVQCHSRRDHQGDLIESQKFRGGAIPVLSPYPDTPFAYQAPSIAGLSGLTDEQVIALLTRGRATRRPAPNPPMPPFRMTQQDAEAIVAYLRSL